MDDTNRFWLPHGVGPHPSAQQRTEVKFVCTAEVTGKFGGKVRCSGTTKTKDGACPLNHLHVDRMMPFSKRVAYGLHLAPTVRAPISRLYA